MKTEPFVAVSADTHTEMRWGTAIAAAALMSLLFASSTSYGAGPGDATSSSKSKAVSFESIAGSKLKRITLTEKAVQRLGIETGKVGEDRIVRKQVVGGVFVVPPAAPPPSSIPLAGSSNVQRAVFATQSAAGSPPEQPKAPMPALKTGEGLVRVMFSPQEWERVAKDQPARISKLSPRSGSHDGVAAKSLDSPPVEDFKRSMLTQYYVVSGQNHGIALNERVRVELQLADTGALRKIVPYGAVYYDAKGDAWVYLNPKPLTYERHAIKIEQVIGDVAVLSAGPNIGTTIVTVGSALLYGAEIYGK